MKNIVLTIVLLGMISSCGTKKIDYISYYNKTLAIDSILRFHKDTLTVVNEYKKHFKKYKPHNQERLKEYETYIFLSHKINKNFGGKKSLYTLIDLITPYKNRYKDYSFFKEYGIDSLEVVARIKKREEKYNKILIDSFTIACERDQSSRQDYDHIKEIEIADLNNVNLFKWTFKNYGFPSTEKVGTVTKWHDDDFYHTLFLHFIGPDSDYFYFKENLVQYIKSGECNPYWYATMVDVYETRVINHKSYYNVHKTFEDLTTQDSIRINKNRASIGLPSMKHTVLIPGNRNRQILKLK